MHWVMFWILHGAKSFSTTPHVTDRTGGVSRRWVRCAWGGGYHEGVRLADRPHGPLARATPDFLFLPPFYGHQNLVCRAGKDGGQLVVRIGAANLVSLQPSDFMTVQHVANVCLSLLYLVIIFRNSILVGTIRHFDFGRNPSLKPRSWAKSRKGKQTP